MQDISLSLRKPIPDRYPTVITDFQEICREFGIDIFLVGAFARDILFAFAHDVPIVRATSDIDFAVAMRSWEQFEEFRNACFESGKFIDDPGQWQRIYSKIGVGVDLVPFGQIESPKGTVMKSRGEFTLNTIGYDLVFADSLIVESENALTFRVASPRGLVLVKLASYSDRPFERQRDLQDIYFIAKNYVGLGNDERVYNSDKDILEYDDFDYETVGARLLGRDIGNLIGTEDLGNILRPLMELEEGGKIEEFVAVIRSDNFFGFEQRDLVLKIIREIRKGIEERIEII